MNTVYYVYNDPLEHPTGYDLLTVDPETMNIVEKSLAVSTLSGILYPLLPISIHDEHVLLCDATDTIFDITNITDRKANYFVNFGSSHRKNILFLIEKSQTLSYNEMIKLLTESFAEKKLSETITSFFESDRFLSIGYLEPAEQSSLERIIIKKSFILYDKNTQQTYSSNDIEFDVLNLDNMGDISILGKHENAFYAVYTPDWSDENKEKMLQSKFLTEKLRMHISKGDIEDNPLLIIFK
jgi:hypothetical protein